MPVLLLVQPREDQKEVERGVSPSGTTAWCWINNAHPLQAVNLLQFASMSNNLIYKCGFCLNPTKTGLHGAKNLVLNPMWEDAFLRCLHPQEHFLLPWPQEPIWKKRKEKKRKKLFQISLANFAFSSLLPQILLKCSSSLLKDVKNLENFKCEG